MGTPLNVLVIEDSQDAAELIVAELRRGGFHPEWKRVETEEDYLAELKKLPDIILSDYSMPQFTGLRAAQLLEESGLNIPFILVSGTTGEENAVEAMKHGATDYLLKDRIARLGNAVKQALDGNRLRVERQQAEEELRESEEKFRQIAENIYEVFWITDPAKHRIIYISPGYKRIWGRTCESLYQSPQSWLEAIHTEDRQRVQDAVMTKQKRGDYDEKYRIVRPDGTMRWIHDRGFPVRNAAEEVYRIVGIAEDVTERKNLEEDLRKSEAEFRVTFENAPMGVALMRTGERLLKTNYALQRMLGYSEDELRGMTLNHLTHPDDAEAGLALHWEMLAGKRDRYQIEKRFFRKSGEIVHGRLTKSLVRGSKGQAQYAIGMIEDITDKKLLEAQFLRARRMESISTLAGGIAHDLNNVLAPILISCELLQMEARDEGMRDLAGMIKASAARGADLVKQVLSFARGVEGRRLAVHPKHLVGEMANFIRGTFAKSISVYAQTPRGLWLISGDPTQLHQVLLNLCVNARDAMPCGGNLSITAENVLVDAGCTSVEQGAKRGPYVVIKVIGTGTGIPAELQEKIFDTFFTTKEVGKGTGLDLSTSLGIVKSHGGFIKVESEVGKGSKFEVWLPAETGNDLSAAPVEESPLPHGNGETILVVDDEESLLALTRQTLEAYGYVVLTAIHGADALAVYSRHKDGIEVILTDVMMPVMDGITFTLALKKMHPDICIIATSGLSNIEHQSKAIGAGAKRFLPKPYNAEMLLNSLAEILHDRQPDGTVPPSTPAGKAKG